MRSLMKQSTPPLRSKPTMLALMPVPVMPPTRIPVPTKGTKRGLGRWKWYFTNGVKNVVDVVVFVLPDLFDWLMVFSANPSSRGRETK